MKHYTYKMMLTATALFAVAGCSFSELPTAKGTAGRAPQVAETPEPDETVRGAEDPAIVTLHLGSHLHERRLSRSEDLPGNIVVPTTNLNAVPVTTALQAVLTGTDVSLSWETGAFENRLVTVTNLSGPLPRVIEKICGSAKVFCAYRHGLLELKEKETFIVELPAVPVKIAAGAAAGAAANTMADEISDLSGEKARVDAQGGNVIYTTDVNGQEAVGEYLKQLRNGRPMIVMQLYIWEVTLNKANGAGINWQNFNFGKFGGALENVSLLGSTAFTALSGGTTLDANLSGKVSATSVLSFLGTQGNVQTISNPQMTFVSGSGSQFKVGGKVRYISQVGQLQSSSVAGTTGSGSNIGTNTVSTDSFDKGLAVDVSGSYENGVITAVLELSQQDVVSLNPTSTSSNPTVPGTTIDLPETTERKVASTIRVRPGDSLVMAGMVTSKDTNNRQGIPLPFGGKLPTEADDTIVNNELVIMVKPSVVLFADDEEDGAPTKSKTKSTDIAKGMPDAVMIDKDGPRTLKVPEAPAQPIKLQPMAAAQKPELMMEEPNPTPLQNTPIAPSEDGAPVDRRLMQRGFSHAFDDLLAPTSSIAAGSNKDLREDMR